MAGDWIKMRGNLWDDPRVAKLCDLTDCGEAQIIGALYWLWASADQHTETGLMPGLTIRQIDRKTGVPGFGAALLEIKWIEERDDGVRIVKFEEHNGKSAKRRCADAQRKAGVREMSASDADTDGTECGNDAEEIGNSAELEKEKRREDIKNTIVPIKTGTPDCPHQEIIDLYHKHCPTMPKVRDWTGKRQRYLQSRWREKPEHQSLEFWRDFFQFVNQSDFLTGRSGGWQSCNLEWLVTQGNFVKVIEGNYENRGVA